MRRSEVLNLDRGTDEFNRIQRRIAERYLELIGAKP